MAKKKARVLVDFSDGERSYRCNDVIESDDKVVGAMAAAGQVDADPGAVAYAMSLKADEAKAKAEAKAEG